MVAYPVYPPLPSGLSTQCVYVPLADPQVTLARFFPPRSAQRSASQGGGGGAQLHRHPGVLAFSSPEPPARPDSRLPGALRAHGERRGQGAAPDQGHHAG